MNRNLLFCVAAAACLGLSLLPSCGSKNRPERDEKQEKTERPGKKKAPIHTISVYETMDATTFADYQTIYSADTAQANADIKGRIPKGMATTWIGSFDPGYRKIRHSLVVYRPKPVIEETIRFREAERRQDNKSTIDLFFRFSDEEKWERITKENIHRQLAIAVDGEIVFAPYVADAISGGNSTLSISEDDFRRIFPELEETLARSDNSNPFARMP